MKIFGVNITSIFYDSRKVSEGSLFVAIKGEKVDGYDFIQSAIEKGAVVVVAERDFNAPDNVKKVIIENSRKELARISSQFYGNPSSKIKIIGITGTNGKTTTAYLLDSIFSSAGYKTGIIGTIETKIGGKAIPSTMTTPESLELQALLAKMVEEKVEYLFIEVSSHALAQYRVYGIEFDVAIFTNLTHDHLDYHKTMANYLAEKKKLFKMIKPDGFALINVDDEYSKEIAGEVEGEIVFYGFTEGKHELRDTKYSDFEVNLKEMHETLDYLRLRIDSMEIKTPLIGIHNVYNILAAFQCATLLNVPRVHIKTGIEKTKVPGRLQRVGPGYPYHIFVDFAHSPDALQKTIETIKKYLEGKLIVVFGCPGDRDKEKRPIMGKISSELADYTIITTDDPHTEEPQLITDDILKGISQGTLGIGNIFAIVDRKEAIAKGFSLLQKGDALLIAGRGHEKYQDFNGEKVILDDVEFVRNMLESR